MICIQFQSLPFREHRPQTRSDASQAVFGRFNFRPSRERDVCEHAEIFKCSSIRPFVFQSTNVLLPNILSIHQLNLCLNVEVQRRFGYLGRVFLFSFSIQFTDRLTIALASGTYILPLQVLGSTSVRVFSNFFYVYNHSSGISGNWLHGGKSLLLYSF